MGVNEGGGGDDRGLSQYGGAVWLRTRVPPLSVRRRGPSTKGGDRGGGIPTGGKV